MCGSVNILIKLIAVHSNDIVFVECLQDVYVYGCPSFWLGLFLIPSIVLLSDIGIKM